MQDLLWKLLQIAIVVAAALLVIAVIAVIDLIHWWNVLRPRRPRFIRFDF